MGRGREREERGCWGGGVYLWSLISRHMGVGREVGEGGGAVHLWSHISGRMSVVRGGGRVVTKSHKSAI